MKIKQIELYEYNELPKDIQKKVIKNFKDDEDYYFLNSDLQDELEILLEENKITSDNAKVQYNLSYSQGDGVMFTGHIEWKECIINITHSGRYYHEKSADFKFQDDMTADEETEFENLYEEICLSLKNFGYDEMNYTTSEKVIIANIEANKYLFNKDGGIETI
jgi:hypothetical protein